MGIFTRVADRLRATTDEDLVPAADRPPSGEDITPIAATGDRERATVQGRVGALTLPTSTAVTALVVDLADDSGSIELIFVGRKAIPGIDTGVCLRATGRVSIKGQQRFIYNPAYEIVPSRGH